MPAKTLSCLAQKQQAIDFWNIPKSQRIPSGRPDGLAEVGILEDSPALQVKGTESSSYSQLARVCPSISPPPSHPANCAHKF